MVTEETNFIIQEELTELSTNEELKQFWLQNNIPLNVGIMEYSEEIFNFLSIVIRRGFSAVTNLLTKKRNRLDIISQRDLKLMPNVDNVLLKHQVHPSH
nr:unnamed protein product [Callosobruchus chinensis]